MRRVRLRLTSAELIAAGVNAGRLIFLALRRARSGRITKGGDHYYDYGFPMPSWLTQILDELTDDGLLILSEEGCGMSRVHLTAAGLARYSQLSAPLQR